MKIAIVGCGNISSAYLENAKLFKSFEIAYVTDLDFARASAQAEKFGVVALSLEDVLASDADAILNLTIPAAHAEIALQALNAGKHIYNEKPLATSLEDAAAMTALAATKNLRIGCAPDTFLGAGLQAARAFLESGGIGQPVGASLHMVATGPDMWHPNPSFFYQEGAGPLFDMGPYYITAMLHFFGAIKRVTAFAAQTRATRADKNGNAFSVNVPTHVTALLEHDNGVLVTLTISFDAVKGSNQNIEIYGSSGALVVNDPNNFSGKLRYSDGLSEWGNGNWHDLEITQPYSENSRGVGLADMAQAIVQNRAHRASGELANHVLEVMHSILKAAQTGTAVTLQSKPERPELLKANMNL